MKALVCKKCGKLYTFKNGVPEKDDNYFSGKVHRDFPVNFGKCDGAFEIKNIRLYGGSSTQKLTLENETNCVEEVLRPERMYFGYSWQCSRKRGHGKNGLYCKQHAKQ